MSLTPSKILCLVSLLPLLAACATPSIWEKPGASTSEFEQMKAACMLEGFRNVPADNHTVLVSGGNVWKNAKCKGSGCSSVSSYTPPQYETVDANAELRNQVVRACFYRSGWNEVKEPE